MEKEIWLGDNKLSIYSNQSEGGITIELSNSADVQDIPQIINFDEALAEKICKHIMEVANHIRGGKNE